VSHAYEENNGGNTRVRAVKATAHLTPREADRARMPLRTLAECGEIMGMSFQSVSRLEQRALGKLRRALIEHGVVDEQGRLVREVEG